MSPQIMQSLKEDLIKVISEYMDIDKSGLEVSLSNESDGVALVCNIPVLSLKRTVS
jgi:cell division topological specificity factor